MQAGPLVSLSPSFNSYASSGKLANIAARVVNELRQESSGGSSTNSVFAFDPIWESLENSSNIHLLETTSSSNPDFQIPQSDENDEEFEFPSIFKELKSSSIPLRKLMIEEEREATTTSSSSFETNELEGLLPESFCVWAPKNTTNGESTRNCKKSPHQQRRPEDRRSRRRRRQ